MAKNSSPVETEPDRFLEPLYVNETMVLNCAAYLFSGFHTESTTVDKTETRKKGGLTASLPFLNDLIGVSGQLEHATSQQRETARKFTLGGLHMNVLDALKQRSMITSIREITDETLTASQILDRYIHCQAVLRAPEYWTLLHSLQTLEPLIHQILEGHSEDLARLVPERAEEMEQILPRVASVSESLREIVDRLLQDYLTSGQVEMIMASVDDLRPFGVVDLEIGFTKPETLKASLAGGRFHVYGKVTARAKTSQKLSLLQRTALFDIADLGNRLYAAAREQQPDIGDDDPIERLAAAFRVLDRVVKVELPGPAFRMKALSICV